MGRIGQQFLEVGSSGHTLSRSDRNVTPRPKLWRVRRYGKAWCTSSAMLPKQIFEELIRRFNEALNENPGEHFTPRDVVQRSKRHC
jgi:hypothetical protein